MEDEVVTRAELLRENEKLRQRLRELEMPLRHSSPGTPPDDYLRLIYEFMSDGVVAFNEEDRVNFANPAMAVLTGRPLSQILDRTAQEAWKESTPKSAPDTPETSTEHNIFLPDGNVRVVLRKNFPLGTDPPIRISIYRDITRRQRAEDRLQRNEAFYRSIIEGVFDLILVIDEEGNCRYASPSAEKALGVSSEEFIGKPLDWLEPEDTTSPSLLHLLSESRHGKKDIPLNDVALRRPGSQPRYFTGALHNFLHVPSLRGFILNLKDETEKRAVQRNLEEREQLFRAVADHLPDALFLVEPKAPYQIVFANTPASTTYGYSHSELLGRPITDLEEEEHAAGIDERMKRVLKGEILAFEGIHRHRDGHFFAVETATRLIEQEGRPLVIGLCRNIQARKQSELLRNVLLRLGERLSGARTPRDAASIALEAADEAFGWDASFVTLLIKERNEIRTLACFDEIDGHRKEIPPAFLTSDEVSNCRLRERFNEPALINPEDPDRQPFRGAFGDENRPSRSLMYCPLRLPEEGLVGLISIQSYTQGSYDERSLKEFEVLADYCGAAISRTRAEDKMRRREALYRQSIVQADAVPYERDFQTYRYVYMEDNIRDIIGYGPEELTPKRWEEITLDGELYGSLQEMGIEEAFRRAEEGKLESWKTDLKVRARDGSVKWLTDSALFMFDENGKPRGTLGILQDITFRKEAEERREAFIKRLHAVIEAADELIQLDDVDDVYRRAMELARGKLGAERCSLFIRDGERLQGTWGTDESGETTDERNLSLSFRKWEAACTHREGYRTYLSEAPLFTYHDGEAQEIGRGWLATTPIMGSSNEMIAMVAIDAAISGRKIDSDLQEVLSVYCTLLGGIIQQKVAEKSLKENEERLRMVARNLPAILWTTDPNQIVTFIDGSGLEEVHATPVEILGRHVASRFDPDDPERTRLIQAHERALEGDSVFGEIRFAGRSLQFKVEPLRDIDDQIVGVIGISQDVTAQREGEEERKRLEARIQHSQKLESLGVLAGGIAHDFNNLLSGVLGNAGLALLQLDREHKVRPVIERIETTALRMSDLTQQMLAYSGRGKFVVEPVDLNTLVMEMTNLLEITISKKARLRYELSEKPVIVEADATQLRQVLMNLITNASEALQGDEGDILVSTGHAPVRRSEFPELPWQEEVEEGLHGYIRVRDTGSGMDRETMRKVFDPFFTTKFTGRGLGLSAVQGIVRSHSGALRIESEVGEGTAFTFYLPVSEESEWIDTAKPPSEESWKGEGTVLVVEDEEVVRKVAAAVLEKHGFGVIEGEDGQEGIDLFERYTDDISAVLLDLTMPRVSGEEAFRYIRGKRPGLPVILMSGYSEQEALQRLEGEEVAGFLAKPFRPAELLEALRQALNREQA